MSGGYTRKTHIVRIPSPDDTETDPTKVSQFVDVEVLDAIAFRIENNREVILTMDATKSTPYIVDDTGGGHAKSPDKATCRSHMTRLTSTSAPDSNGDTTSSALDVEVLDCWAALDQNGGAWILDMQPGAGGGTAFNISDGTGDQSSTRREHNEIITTPPGLKKDDPNASGYVTSVRSDNIAFRKINNKEVIISIPSCDDPNATGVDFGRASTYMTPSGYDPNDTSDSAVAPPLLAKSGDQHNYVNFVSDGNGGYQDILTSDKKIDMGPFWWIRKIQTGGGWFGLSVGVGEDSPSAGIFPGGASIAFMDQYPDGGEGYFMSVGTDGSLLGLDASNVGSGAGSSSKNTTIGVYGPGQADTTKFTTDFLNGVIKKPLVVGYIDEPFGYFPVSLYGFAAWAYGYAPRTPVWMWFKSNKPKVHLQLGTIGGRPFTSGFTVTVYKKGSIEASAATGKYDLLSADGGAEVADFVNLPLGEYDDVYIDFAAGKITTSPSS